MHSETGPDIKILVVDDDKVVADILKDLASEKERSVDVCYDGLAAIESIQRNVYDIIIVDLVMPRLDGIEVLRYAKKVNPEVIVIIITGYASLETAIAAIREGAYDYIRKPCKLEEIKIVVDNAIDKIRLNKENRELLQKLQDAYHELIVLKKDKDEDERKGSLHFFSSEMPALHYIFNAHHSPGNCVDTLEALSSLKEKGLLTEDEFKSFKQHLLKTISLSG
jgi:DNA-binding response OmpR family regulator